nr:MFS transporter [Pseudomonas aeruginosa]
MTGRRLFILGNSFSKPIPLNPFPFLYIPQFSRFTLLVYLTLSHEKHKDDYPEGYDEHHERELSTKEIFVTYVLRNKLLWYIALANVFVYLLRYGVLDWAPTYLKEAKHFNVDKSSWAYFFYEWAGIPGTLLCGWLSDKLFKGNRGATGVVFMILVTVGTLIYWLNPAGNPAIDMAALIMIGFLIYGPVMLIGLQALELAPKKAAGTAAGFTGLFGYLGGSVAANALVGYTVDHFGWDGGFKLLIGACLLAILFLCLTLRKPAVQAAPQQAG